MNFKFFLTTITICVLIFLTVLWGYKNTNLSVNNLNKNNTDSLIKTTQTIITTDKNSYQAEILKILNTSPSLINSNNLSQEEFQKAIKKIPRAEIDNLLSKILNIVISTSVKDTHLNLVIALNKLKQGNTDEYIKIIKLLEQK